MTLFPPIAEAFQLRPYQGQAHAAIREARDEGVHGVMIVMATGTGKTATALSFIIEDYLARGLRVAWIAHRKELVTQPRDTIARFWPHLLDRVGIVQGSCDQPEADLVCASVDTLARSPHRAEAILAAGPIALLVVDEAHHSTSPTQQAAIQSLAPLMMLGLTATADREDGADLGEHWEIRFSYDILAAIRDGALLVPYAYTERLPDLDLSRVSGRRDYDDAELGAELLRAGVVAHTVDMMSRAVAAKRLPDRDSVADLSAQGRGCLVFTATVEQARRTAEALREAGWRANHISGSTPDAERSRMLRAFKSGAIDVLCNAAVLTEGTDLPRASCVVLARPTRSWSLFVQMVGRGLRLHVGQADALVLDLAGATEDHSLVSAPVLIGGSKCPKAPNGIHELVVRKNPQDGADCEHCGRKVASCGILLGPHKWGADHNCEGCERPQCLDSDDGTHHWTPVEDHKRRCIDCGMEIPDPLAGMASRSRSETVKADWIRLPGLVPETFVVGMGEHGLLFVVRQRPGWMPIWLRKRARKPRPLASRPMRREHVRGYADDLVRRAAKHAAKEADWKQGRPDSSLRYRYRDATGDWPQAGLDAGRVARVILIDHARKRAIKTGIAREL